MTNVIANRDHAIEAAIARADENGAPCAVLIRDSWYRIEESAEEFERLIDEEHWEQFAVIDPTEEEDA